MSTLSELEYEQRRRVLKALDFVASRWKSGGMGIGTIRRRKPGGLLCFWAAHNDGVGGTMVVLQFGNSPVGVWARGGPWEAWRVVGESDKSFPDVVADVAESAGLVSERES